MKDKVLEFPMPLYHYVYFYFLHLDYCIGALLAFMHHSAFFSAVMH